MEKELIPWLPGMPFTVLVMLCLDLLDPSVGRRMEGLPGLTGT